MRFNASRARPPGGDGPRIKNCKTCKQGVSAGALLHGECPDCAGLLALDLRGEGDRFLSLSPRSRGRASGATGASEAPSGGEG